MWIWIECEDYNRASGDVKVVDDWGAAGMRCVRLGAGASVVYHTPLASYTAPRLTLRCRAEDATGEALLLLNAGGGWSAPLRINAQNSRQWQWISVSDVPTSHSLNIRNVGRGTCWLDGLFSHDEDVELPERVRVLDEMIGRLESEGLGYETPDVRLPSGRLPLAEMGLPDFRAMDSASTYWSVIDSIASKACPYIVNAYDTGKETDCNSDYSWHALGKEKRWEIAGSGLLGLVNPNTDIWFAVGFGVDGAPIYYRVRFRPVVHTVDMLIYAAELDEQLRCTVVMWCCGSDTVLVRAHFTALRAGADRRVLVGTMLGRTGDNPPKQRYVLPGQKFGAGVTTTTGRWAWGHCYYEWVRGRCQGRRLLLSEAHASDGEPFDFDVHLTDGEGTIEHSSVMAYPLVVPAGRAASVAFALNLRRFTIGSDWNPEVTPHLYRRETEQEAVEAGYRACVEALGEDLEEAIRRSIEPYRIFPKITLPIESWESDFYACLELPRASTFSPYGDMKTPFYGFCRVHAHEPMGWWSYGMHAHESLCTLFTNITDPDLSAKFLLGHIRHQREDGKYPYGVSHAINPRLTTEEATAPLIVWEAWQSYLWSGDREFLREAYESGKRNHDWWLRNRDLCGEGLCHWLDTCNESVRDDGGLPTWQLTGGSQYQEALDLNCYLLVQARTIAAMALELGLQEEAESYRDLADRTARMINAYMWHEEDRVYYGIGEVVPSWANVKDISTFFPLWAGLAPKGRFERIVELVTDPETFGLPYGPPTLAANEPCFGPEKHWYGSNWVEMSMFAIDGLKRYGCYQLAADLAYQNTKMVFDELERYGHFREYFNSIEGNGVDLIDYIWTAMPAHFIVSVFLGIEPQGDGLAILPALPTGWDRIEIESLRVRGANVSVKVTADPGASETTATLNGEQFSVVENRGVVAPWGRMTDGARVEIVQPKSIEETHAAPVEAPPDWSHIPAHPYPDDAELIKSVREKMKTKEECAELF